MSDSINKNDSRDKNTTCLSQIENWKEHGNNPEKAINFHLSKSNKVAGLTEAPLATGETMDCFDHDNDSSKTLEKMTTVLNVHSSDQQLAKILRKHQQQKQNAL